MLDPLWCVRAVFTEEASADWAWGDYKNPHGGWFYKHLFDVAFSVQWVTWDILRFSSSSSEVSPLSEIPFQGLPWAFILGKCGVTCFFLYFNQPCYCVGSVLPQLLLLSPAQIIPLEVFLWLAVYSFLRLCVGHYPEPSSISFLAGKVFREVVLLMATTSQALRNA